MASRSKDATPMWDIMSPEDDKAVLEKFTAESNKVINRWSLGDATFTEKDAAVAFLVQLGAVEITIQSGSQQTTSQKQVSIQFGDREDSKIDEEHRKADPRDTKDAVPSEGNQVKPTPDLSDQDEEKKNEIPVRLDQDTKKNGEAQVNEDDDDDEDEDDEDSNGSVWMPGPDDEDDDDYEDDDDDNQIPDRAPVAEDHSTSHSEEEHTCPYCHIVLNSLLELDLHKLRCKCMTKQVYNCDQCSKSFTAKGYAVKHLHKAHNMSLNEAGEKLEDLKSSKRQSRRKRMHGAKSVGKRHCSDKNAPRQSKRLLLKLKPLSTRQTRILESKAVDVSEITSDGMRNEPNGNAAVSNSVSESEDLQGDVKEKNTMSALGSNMDHECNSDQVQEKDISMRGTEHLAVDREKENGSAMSSELRSDEHPGFPGVVKKTKEVNNAYDGDHEKGTTQKRVFRKTSRSCKFCDLQFQSVRSRDNHMFITHPEEVQAYKCSTCNKSFTGKFPFKAHLQTHMDDREKYCCKICKKTFLIKFSYNKHMKSHVEKPEGLKCDTCGKFLSSKRELERHINSKHKREVVYTCEICGKNFYTTSNIKQHLETHTKEKTWKCDKCGYAAYREHNLIRHKQQVHTTGGECICEICGAPFKTSLTLKQHLRNVHTDCKFSCDVCGKKFKRASALRMHVKIHSDDPKNKPFQCEICGKCFRARQKVQEHMTTHNNEQSYTCHHCGKTFKKKYGFDKHQFIHTGKKPHQCRICSQEFMAFVALRKHLDVKHQITLTKRGTEKIDKCAKLLDRKLAKRPSSPSNSVTESEDRTEFGDVGHPEISDDAAKLHEASDSQVVEEALLAMMND